MPSIKKKSPRKRTKPTSIDDLYGGGESGNFLHPDYDTPKVYAWFQKRHQKGRLLIDKDGYYRTTVDGKAHEWRVPFGVRQAMRVPLVYNQITVRYPFYVTWISRKTGKRHKHFVPSLISGIHLITTRIQYGADEPSIVSRTVGYGIPAGLRGKFPRKMNGKLHYWCPACMTARRFKRTQPEQEIHAMKKFWNTEKFRYDWKDVRLALLECTTCGTTNRDHRFRSSNQPYEKRRIKQGVRRIKKRKSRRKK